MCIPWVWAGFREKMLNLKVFAFWICTKKIDAQSDEKDTCYLQIMHCLQKVSFDTMSCPLAGHITSASAVICFTYIVQKFEFQTTDCSKQIPDLLTAVYISKRTQWTIGKSIVLCVFLGFGLDFAKKCLTWKFLHFEFVQKKLMPKDEKDKCYVQIMSLSQKINVDTMSSSLAGRFFRASAILCVIFWWFRWSTWLLNHWNWKCVDRSMQFHTSLQLLHKHFSLQHSTAASRSDEMGRG